MHDPSDMILDAILAAVFLRKKRVSTPKRPPQTGAERSASYYARHRLAVVTWSAEYYAQNRLRLAAQRLAKKRGDL